MYVLSLGVKGLMELCRTKRLRSRKTLRKQNSCCVLFVWLVFHAGGVGDPLRSRNLTVP